MFIIKYDTSGNVVNATYLPLTGGDTSFGTSIALDSSGNIYVTGSYTSINTVTVLNLNLTLNNLFHSRLIDLSKNLNKCCSFKMGRLLLRWG